MTKDVAVSSKSLFSAVPAAFCGALLAALTILCISGASLSRFAPFAILPVIAKLALGHTPLSLTEAYVIGALIHVAISFSWALGYAIVALRTPALTRSPLISGISYGLLIELIMNGILVMIGAAQPMSPSDFLRDILAHTLGFGVPIAYVVAYMLPQATPSQSR